MSVLEWCHFWAFRESRRSRQICIINSLTHGNWHCIILAGRMGGRKWRLLAAFGAIILLRGVEVNEVLKPRKARVL